MQDMLGFAALNTPENIPPVQGNNSTDLPPLDPLDPPFPPDMGHSSADSLPSPAGSPSKEKGLPTDAPVSTSPVNKPSDPSAPIDTGFPVDPFPPTTDSATDQFPGEPIDPNFQGDPMAPDPAGADPFANDPFANDPFANDPFANDPFANDPFLMDPGVASGDVPTIHQESPFFQFIPNSLKHNSQNSGSQDPGPGLPIQTDQGLPSDSFKSNVKKVDTVDTVIATDPGHPKDGFSPAFPTDAIPFGAGTPIDSSLPTDPMPIEQFVPDHGFSGSEIPTVTGDSPLFRFLPSMPTGDKFLNLNDGSENTFQPTDNWMGEPLGVAKLEPNGLDPWDPFLPEAPMTDVNLGPAVPGTNIDIPQDHGSPISPNLTPVNLNPLGPAEPTVMGSGQVVGDPHLVPIDHTGTIPLGPVDEIALPIGGLDHNLKPSGAVGQNVKPLTSVNHDVKPLRPADHNTKQLGSVDHNVIPLGPVDQGAIPLGTVGDNVKPLGPVDHHTKQLWSVDHNVGPVDQGAIPLGTVGDNLKPLAPVDHITKPPGLISNNVISLGPADRNAIPLESGVHNVIPFEPIGQSEITPGLVNVSPQPIDKTPVKPIDQTVIPLGPVDIVPEKPKIDPNVIPLGPIFGTPVILNPVDNTDQGQSHDGRSRSKPSLQKIPSSWMQLYTKDRRRPNKKLPGEYLSLKMNIY